MNLTHSRLTELLAYDAINAALDAYDAYEVELARINKEYPQ